MIRRRMQDIVTGQGAAFGVEAELTFETHYPATINDADKVAFAAGVAAEISGADAVVADRPKEMGAEDFSYMLENARCLSVHWTR